jgi:hypothetical protein
MDQADDTNVEKKKHEMTRSFADDGKLMMSSATGCFRMLRSLIMKLAYSTRC